MTTKLSMLLVVDAQNLYYSARELYGRGSRVDFLRLRDRIAGEREFSVVYSVAYVPEVKDETRTLARAMRRLGYEILARSEHFDEQVLDLAKLAEQYPTVAVASGDGAFLPLYHRLKELGKRVEVYSFVDAVNAEVPKAVDVFEYLKTDVLLGDIPTMETVKEA